MSRRSRNTVSWEPAPEMAIGPSTTAGEVAVHFSHGQLSLDRLSSNNKLLADQPAKRWPHHNAFIRGVPNFNRTGYANSILLQIGGDLPPEPCSSCKNGKGRWKVCVVTSGEEKRACASCAWTTNNKRCSHHPDYIPFDPEQQDAASSAPSSNQAPAPSPAPDANMEPAPDADMDPAPDAYMNSAPFGVMDPAHFANMGPAPFGVMDPALLANMGPAPVRNPAPTPGPAANPAPLHNSTPLADAERKRRFAFLSGNHGDFMVQTEAAHRLTNLNNLEETLRQVQADDDAWLAQYNGFFSGHNAGEAAAQAPAEDEGRPNKRRRT